MSIFKFAEKIKKGTLRNSSDAYKVTTGHKKVFESTLAAAIKTAARMRRGGNEVTVWKKQEGDSLLGSYYEPIA